MKAEERNRVSEIVEVELKKYDFYTHADMFTKSDILRNCLDQRIKGREETLRQVREMIQSISIQHSIKRLKGKVNPIIVCLCRSYCRAYSDASYVSYREHLEREILSELDRVLLTLR